MEETNIFFHLFVVSSTFPVHFIPLGTRCQWDTLPMANDCSQAFQRCRRDANPSWVESLWPNLRGSAPYIWSLPDVSMVSIHIYIYTYYIWTGLQPHPLSWSWFQSWSWTSLPAPLWKWGRSLGHHLSLYVCMCAHMYACMHVCMHACRYVLATARHLSATLIDLLLYLHRHLRIIIKSSLVLAHLHRRLVLH